MYIGLLNKIKNAQTVGQQSIRYPYSTMDDAILEVLTKAHFVRSVEKKGKNPKRYFEVELAYKNSKGVINGIEFVSKPSRKIYTSCADIKQVKQGYGVAILTTPEGIMTGDEAKKKNVGGQVLFTIW